PFEAVEYMNRIVRTIEENFKNKDYNLGIYDIDDSDVSNAIGKAACLLAEQINASAIITLTSTTLTTKKIAKYRPTVPIIAVTNSDHVHRRLNFVWGVTSLFVEGEHDFIN